LAAALLRSDCYPHAVRRVRLIETHISWVLLTGDWAYKVKKPVDLGFVDFSTLKLRQHYCEEELQLNRRLAPAIYDSVVAIRGTPDAPRIGAAGPVLEYAVRMRQFPQNALAERMLRRRAFGAQQIDHLARTVAEFHARAPAATPATRLGTPAAIYAAAMQNFSQLRTGLAGTVASGQLHALSRWTRTEHAATSPLFALRRRRGHVRECHGDLHLGNIAVIDGRPTPFDCIEFNAALRWIDVLSEVAFLLMDLEDHGRADLAARFLNRYLEETGDYEGIAVLRYYLVYRALVRAKVGVLRGRQPGASTAERKRLAWRTGDYLALAHGYTIARPVALIITHGLSGSGKTTATQSLIERAGAVRIRSDVERKRLFGLAPLARSGSGLGTSIYTAAANAATYERLGELARGVLAAGWPVVVDAAFLKRAERDAFRLLAAEMGVPFVILDFVAPLALLEQRVAARAHDASEADRAVLARQLAFHEPLVADEQPATHTLDASRPVSPRTWRPLLERFRNSRAHTMRRARPR